MTIRNTCLNSILLYFSEIRVWGLREICVFFRGDFNGTPPQRRSSTLTFTFTHTHTHTWRANSGWQVKWFQIFRVLQIFLIPKEGRKNFLTDRGSRISEKDFQTCKCFQLFMYVFFLTRALCRTGFRWLGFYLSCEVSLLEINSMPTAG